MKEPFRPFPVALALVLFAVVFASCTTVNRLDLHRTENATIAANLRVPPEPRFDVHYAIVFDSKNPVGTALSIGSNIAVAAQASRVEDRMREALMSIDVPRIVLDETSAAAAQALDARQVSRKFQADYLLDLEVREYGIRADSPRGAVRLFMRLRARIYHNRSGDLVWRRNVSFEDRASPAMFGFGDIIGNVVTASALADLSTKEIADGFEQLALHSSRAIARKLERDLYAVRYR